MTAGPARTADRGSHAWLPVYLLFFIALSFAKAPRILIEPRFWAEEGNLYFATLRKLPALEAALFTVNGSLQLITNVVAWLATKVPLQHAPAVTTYTAYAVELLVALLIYRFVMAYRINHLAGLLLVAAWLLLPPSYETWASITNIQWVCSVSMLLVLLLPEDDVRRNIVIAAIWTALCGLTGVTSSMLAPWFLARAFLDRSKTFAVLGVILSLAAVLQLAIAISHPAGTREFAFSPSMLMVPTLLQTMLTPLAGVRLVGTLVASIREGTAPLAALALVYAAAIPVAALAIALARRAVRGVLVALAAGMWFAVTAKRRETRDPSSPVLDDAWIRDSRLRRLPG